MTNPAQKEKRCETRRISEPEYIVIAGMIMVYAFCRRIIGKRASDQSSFHPPFCSAQTSSQPGPSRLNAD